MIAELKPRPASDGRPLPDGNCTVVFAGTPNAGKTTVFNRLTGLRAKTANYHGTTVEVRRALLPTPTGKIEIMDLPGTYSLDGATPDQQVASEYLRTAAASTCPPLVVLVIDATKLERSLTLAAELKETGVPVLVALNMADVARSEKLEIDIEALAADLEAEVLLISARTGEGLDQLRARIHEFADAKDRPPADCGWMCPMCSGCPRQSRRQWASDLCQRSCRRQTDTAHPQRSDRFDHWLLHPLWGLLAFVAVMTVLFQSIFWLAEIPMGWIEDGFELFGEVLHATLPPGILLSFLADGVVAGLGGVLIFLPQICILFFLISLLEDTGYLARAACVTDRWMRKVGIPGKAFIPFLSAHACAIPAIMSTRTIANPRDRLATIMVLPLLSCAARLPIYVMLTAVLFYGNPLLAGLVLSAAYFLGIATAFAVALALRHSLLKGKPSPLLIELPTYKMPSLNTAGWVTLDRGGAFVKRAGTIIFAVAVMIWALSFFPQTGSGESSEHPPHAAAQSQLEQSYIGRTGQLIQPVFAPLGFDWKITVSVLTAFAAREVVPSTLSILYGLDDDAPDNIGERLRASIPMATGLSMLVFFTLALQCPPTLIITWKETRSWKWAALQFGMISALAYTAALIVYQCAS